jgi:hypothetical protein
LVPEDVYTCELNVYGFEEVVTLLLVPSSAYETVHGPTPVKFIVSLANVVAEFKQMESVPERETVGRGNLTTASLMVSPGQPIALNSTTFKVSVPAVAAQLMVIESLPAPEVMVPFETDQLYVLPVVLVTW